MRRNVALTLALSAAALSADCSLKTMAAKTVADTLSAGGDVFSRDDDPELVRDAVPFALKTYESLLETIPRHQALLIATCSGFTQYAFAFVQTDAELIEYDNVTEGQRLKQRALKMYVRAWDYCQRALEVRFPGITARLIQDPVAALTRAEARDAPLLYWSAASRGAAISLAPDQPDLVVDLPLVRAFAERALALDEKWDRGALHELMIGIESQQTLGGSPEKARQHFDRAVVLQNGLSPGPYVALALGVTVPKQDRAEFEKLLKQALAIDPEADRSRRLPTILSQRRARALLDHADSLFAQ
jgi:predicted anti-sigma-YlaC factor YlaD